MRTRTHTSSIHTFHNNTTVKCLCCVRERVNPHTQVSHRALAPTHRCLLAQLNILDLPLSKAVLLCTHRISICWRPHTRAWAHTCTRGTRTFTPKFTKTTQTRGVSCVSARAFITAHAQPSRVSPEHPQRNTHHSQVAILLWMMHSSRKISGYRPSLTTS